MATFLTFKLHNEVFAANTKKVLEVLLDYKFSEVPYAPEYIKGVINYRGDIIPVVNFRQKFMFPKKENTENHIIVFDISDEKRSIKFGAVVDKVQNVFETDNIKEKPEFGSKYNPEYLEGIIKQNDDFIMLLNIKKIFTDTEIQIISEL